MSAWQPPPGSTWRRKPFPRCPACGRGASHAGHRGCRFDGHLWIDLATGMVRCDACDARWPLEDTKHHSPCGAVFVGGEVWEGMAIELTRIAHVEWIRRLGITRGELRPRVVDWWNRYQHCAVRRDQHGRDCECALPKLCLDDDCRCGRRKGCTDHADHRCDRLAVCASPRCTCTRPKVKV